MCPSAHRVCSEPGGQKPVLSLSLAFDLGHGYKLHLHKIMGYNCPSMPFLQWPLTHWGRVTHICFGKLTIIGSDNGLSPGRRQAIIWTNAGILLIGPLGTNFSEIIIKIDTISFKKMHLKMSSAKWRPFCLGLNVLRHGWGITSHRELWNVITNPCSNLRCSYWLISCGLLTKDVNPS